MKNKKVYQIEDKDGNRKANYSTGTRIYTRKSNAMKKLHLGVKVVEYELVPTGEFFTKNEPKDK